MLATLLLAAHLTLGQPGLGDCARIDAPMERLSCYDQLAGREPAPAAMATPLEMSSPAPALEAPKSEEELRAEFEEQSRLARSGNTPSITSGITEIVIDRHDRLTLILDNGQVWRQLSGDRPFRVNSKKPPQSATIMQGAVGSYKLKLDDSRQSIRVRRVK